MQISVINNGPDELKRARRYRRNQEHRHGRSVHTRLGAHQWGASADCVTAEPPPILQQPTPPQTPSTTCRCSPRPRPSLRDAYAARRRVRPSLLSLPGDMSAWDNAGASRQPPRRRGYQTLLSHSSTSYTHTIALGRVNLGETCGCGIATRESSQERGAVSTQLRSCPASPTDTLTSCSTLPATPCKASSPDNKKLP